MTDSAAAEQAPVDATGRRALMGAGLVGAALAVAASRPASAAGAQISDDDIALATFAIGFELAARDLYAAVIAGGGTEQAWELLREQHSQYAQGIAGVIGVAAKEPAAEVFAAYEADFTGDHPVNAAFAFENVAAATHAELLGQIVDVGIAEKLASIAAIESSHAAYLAERSGRGENFDALFVNNAAPFVPGGES